MSKEWFYNFNWIQVFDEETAILKAALNHPNSEDDPSGIGKRLVSLAPDINSLEKSPVWLPEIKVLLHDFIPRNQESNPDRMISDGPPSIETQKFALAKIFLKKLMHLKKIKKLLGSDSSLIGEGLTPLKKLEFELTQSAIEARDLASIHISGRRLKELKKNLLKLSDVPFADEIPFRSPREIIGLDSFFDPKPGKDDGNGVKIAIIDTGFNIENGSLDIQEYFDFAPKEPKKTFEHSHGTRSLSIIAGSRNSIAPAAKIYLARVGSSVSHSGVMSAISWALIKEVDIISISFDLPRHSKEPYVWFEKLLNLRLQTLCVVACGRNNANVKSSALATTGKCISVNGQNAEGFLWFMAAADDKLARVDCVSAGDNVESKDLLVGGEFVPHRGVSAATPLVAGALAIYSQRTGYKGERLKFEFIKNCCEPLGLDFGRDGGSGLVDISLNTP